MKSVGLFEAKTRLSALVEAARRGEVTVISVRGTPVARLVPLEEGVRTSAISRLLANDIPLGMSIRDAIDEGRA